MTISHGSWYYYLNSKTTDETMEDIMTRFTYYFAIAGTVLAFILIIVKAVLESKGL